MIQITPLAALAIANAVIEALYFENGEPNDDKSWTPETLDEVAAAVHTHGLNRTELMTYVNDEGRTPIGFQIADKNGWNIQGDVFYEHEATMQIHGQQATPGLASSHVLTENACWAAIRFYDPESKRGWKIQPIYSDTMDEPIMLDIQDLTFLPDAG